MFKNIANAAKSLKEKIDIGTVVENSKQAVATKLEEGKTSTSKLLEEYWPTIERVLLDGLLTIAEEKLNDSNMLETIFSKAYETLPIAIRLVLSRDKFLELSMARREPLLAKIQDYRVQRESEPALSITDIETQRVIVNNT